MAFDLDAVIAEAKPAPKTKQFTFTFGGEEYAMVTPASSLGFDRIALNAAANHDYVTALVRLLPELDYQRIVRSPELLDGKRMFALLNAYYQHVAALDVGESVASTRSLKSTARPSKPTSKSTTKSRSRS